MSDKFTFRGKIYEIDDDGNLIRSVSTADITAGSGISIDKTNDIVTISSDLGLSVTGGQLCTTFVKEV